METSAVAACEHQLLIPLQLHTIRRLGQGAPPSPNGMIPNGHPAASSAGGLCVPRGTHVRAGL